MTTLKLGTLNISIRPRCVATFSSIYGIGDVKAKRLNAFILNHPHQTVFKKDLMYIMQDPIGYNIANKLFIDTKIRLLVSHFIRDKMFIFCYQAYRLFQNLPQKGQRTRSNSGTSRRLNPFLSLKVNQSLYLGFTHAYKRRELFFNSRHEELEAYNKALEETDKMRKEDEKNKNKKAQQEHFKKLKKIK